MPNMKVNTSAMRSSSAKLYMNSIKLTSCVATLNAVRKSLPFSDEIAHEIDRALKGQIDRINYSNRRIRKMVNVINESAGIYENSENVRSIGAFLVLDPDWRRRFQLIGSDEDTFGFWNAAVGGSVLSGAVAGGVTIFGTPVNGSAQGSVINYGASAGVTSGMEVDEDGNITRLGAGVEGEANFNLAHGELSGNIGNLSGTASGSVGNVAVEGEAGATLFSDGMFAPSLYGSLAASASVLAGTANINYEGDGYTLSGTASGEVLTAEAYANGGAGYITYENEAGQTVSAWGVQGEVGAEAYVAKGTLSGGFEIFGIEFNASVTGGAGGAGLKAGGHATTGGVSGELGVGLGVGGDVSFSIDWSGFEGGEALEAAGDFIEDTGEFLGDIGESVSDFFTDLF